MNIHPATYRVNFDPSNHTEFRTFALNQAEIIYGLKNNDNMFTAILSNMPYRRVRVEQIIAGRLNLEFEQLLSHYRYRIDLARAAETFAEFSRIYNEMIDIIYPENVHYSTENMQLSLDVVL